MRGFAGSWRAGPETPSEMAGLRRPGVRRPFGTLSTFERMLPWFGCGSNALGLFTISDILAFRVQGSVFG